MEIKDYSPGLIIFQASVILLFIGIIYLVVKYLRRQNGKK
jgi:hypothetical protein